MLKVQLSIEYIVLSIEIEEYSVGSGSWQGKVSGLMLKVIKFKVSLMLNSSI